jgi:hypothetical protein
LPNDAGQGDVAPHAKARNGRERERPAFAGRKRSAGATGRAVRGSPFVAWSAR